ncbi:MAG TPA: hypothetical protein VNS55_06775 [Nocardioides sp.]|nr:hypothetical protein [Nocardioides sp.]
MPIARSTVIGAIAGVVVLGGFVGFAVGLPKLTDEEAGAATTDRPAVAEDLPQTLLDGQLMRVSSFNPEVGEQVEKYGSDTLTKVFGADTAVGRYISSDGRVELSITVSDAGGGLFLQSGPPTPRQMTQAQGFVQRSRRVDDVPCAELFPAQPGTDGQPAPDPTKSAPVQVQCQTEIDGRAFNAYVVGGLTAEQTVQALDEAITADSGGAQDQ